MSQSANISDIYASLPEGSQKTLLEFALFLQSKAPAVSQEISAPLDIPRPAEESVIAGIKRLNKTYPMIDRSLLLNETSNLMMQHMMSGKAAIEVIDELEIIFEQKYQQLVGSTE